jgi:hypothetical protein|tara:strand:+ start:160 stop:291 length:132 start_codon:yes stop_codon:yes gene_type:complete
VAAYPTDATILFNLWFGDAAPLGYDHPAIAQPLTAERAAQWQG